MSLSADLREFIELLNAQGVDYVIVGAHSLAFHARPRYTGDIDILIRPTAENAERIVTVLQSFGFASSEISASDFTQPERVIQLGRAPNRIDLLTSISGVDVDDALRTRITADMDGLHVYILSRNLLVQNKRAVGRAQDIADLEALGEAAE